VRKAARLSRGAAEPARADTIARFEMQVCVPAVTCKASNKFHSWSILQPSGGILKITVKVLQHTSAVFAIGVPSIDM